MRRQFYIIIFLIVICNTSYALVSLESLILGDFSQRYIGRKSDPLNYVFKPQEDLAEHGFYKKKLGKFVGFYQEGRNLINSCKIRRRIQYRSSWSQEQVLRSVYSTAQYVGIDMTLRAIASYARFFEFSEDEFKNMTDRLVGNYCSKNLSIISLRNLKKNFAVMFKEGNFQLPSIINNPLYPETLLQINTRDKALEQEFLHTVKLFRAFCSWGGDTKNLRLMVPLMKNSIIMSFVIRQVAGLGIKWQPIDNTLYVEKNPNTVKVLCKNLVCRKVKSDIFENKIPKSIGSEGVADDVKRLYCNHIRDVDYVLRNQVPEIKKWLDHQTFDDENLMISQFIALVTGVPDFFVRSNRFNGGIEFMRASVDQSWDQWSKEQNENFDRELYYEESLSVEKVDRKYYYSQFYPIFKVVFDVNLGEFDRINQITGKITAKFDLNLPKNFLQKIRKEWAEADPRIKGLRPRIIKKFRAHIEHQVKAAKDKFAVTLWKGDIESIVIKELLHQLVNYDGDYFNNISRDMVKIPIEFNLAPFALKYINYQYKIGKNEIKNIKK